LRLINFLVDHGSDLHRYGFRGRFGVLVGSTWEKRREPCSLVSRRQQAVSASITHKDETPAGGRRRRAFGTVERLPSGNFRARVLGPGGQYVSAPMTFATKADATLWLEVQRADQVRGLWRAPAPRVDVRSVGEYVQEWITRHPSARPGTKELYAGLLRTCIVEDLGEVPVTDLTAEDVRRWHFELGERLAADADRRRTALLAKVRQVSSASVSDGRTRLAQAYRLLRAAMARSMRRRASAGRAGLLITCFTVTDLYVTVESW